MKKEIYYGNSDFFGREDFLKLMEDLSADKLAEQRDEESEFWRKLASEDKVVYYSHKDNVALVHVQSSGYYDSKVFVFGASKKISLIEKKLLDKVKDIKTSCFSLEGLRID